MSATTETKSLYTGKSFLIACTVSAVYLLLSWLLIGYKPDQLYLVVFFNSFYFISRTTRKFITGLSIFIVYWVIFDYMKAFPNYRYNQVHIADLYQAEKNLFGISGEGATLTPNEYWALHSRSFLDVITGIFYLCWVPVPLAFAVYLFFKNRMGFLHFSLSFFLVNLIGFAVYYIYPAAPPWYVQQHGFAFIANTPGNTGGLEKFDLFFGAGIFQSLYSKSSNVFAAMPSLHASYPLIVLYYGIVYKAKWFNLFFGMVMLGIWFAAVYNSHHYVLDVLAGIGCAIISLLVFRVSVQRETWVKRFVTGFVKKIS
ncbi:phosphatase PAP2 family protein [Sediminibacterium soli]|uniref:phosphatase PAP2 family protein n=1 Tax=Sediminibacterium soli TaxID=2698829 RepID=UPI001379E544|nr:phosphatase PAP2 family protein [Sediminibacterium soli]NCI45172.1 inositol phosphorylceramide synthase [Sediminibacterium soli]